MNRNKKESTFSEAKQSETPQTKNKTLEYLAIGFVLIMVFILGLKKLYSPDIGFHLEAGKWMLENCRVMGSDVFTYTGFGTPYYDLNWLYQISVYKIFHWFGASGLVLINSLLITVSVLMLFVRLRLLGISKFHLAILLLIIGIIPFPMEVRPHVVSVLFLNALLYILELYKFKKVNRLYWLPFIVLGWINFHSLGILGIVVIGTYTVGAFLEEKKIDKLLLRYLLLSILAMVITPFLFNGFLFIFKQFLILSDSGNMSEYVGELASPFSLKGLYKYGIGYLSKPYFWLHVFMAISVVAAITLLRIKQFTLFLICVLFFVLLSLAKTNYVYFFFVAYPYMVFVWARKKEEKPKASAFSRFVTPNRVNGFSLTIAIIIGWTSITGGYRIITDDTVQFGIAIDKQYLPVEATEFLVNNNIKGKLLNHFDFGGYLAHFYSEKTFIDGRLEVVDETTFNEYYNSIYGDNGLAPLIEKHQPDIIIFPYFKAQKWWGAMLRNPDWRLIYVDHLTAVYVPQKKYPEIPTVTEASILKRIPQYNAEQIQKIFKQDKNSKTLAFFKSFVEKQNSATEYETLSMFCFASGFTNAALSLAAATINEATYSPSTTYYNLYHFYSLNKDFKTANVYLKKSGQKKIRTKRN
ncbi:MAG: hypothetical protein IPO21_16130 [Bacteroidales bacterium]|nr:hypothetical protein [Bacteroidales bacterium]